MKFARLLARMLGRSVHELGASMSLAEFMGHYQDYVDGELMPITLGDLHVCAAIANWAGKVMKPGARVTAGDFNPYGGHSEVPSTPSDADLCKAFGIG